MVMGNLAVGIKVEGKIVLGQTITEIEIFSVPVIVFIPPGDLVSGFFSYPKESADAGFKRMGFVFGEMALEIAGKEGGAGEKTIKASEVTESTPRSGKAAVTFGLKATSFS